MTMTYAAGLEPLDISLEPRQAPEPIRARLFARVRRRLSAHRVDLVVMALLLLVVGWVHLDGMYDNPARFDDEGTYTAYAWAVGHLGQLCHYTYWYAHPPLGWIQMAGWAWLTDGFDRAPYSVAAVREMMLVTKLLDVALMYLLARRLLFGRVGASIAVLAFGLSPLAVYFTRAALLDNLVTPWLLAAFLIAAAPRRSLASATWAALCIAVAVLTKETALLYLPAVVAIFLARADHRNRRFTISLFGAVFMLVCAIYPLFALIKGELLAGPGHVSIETAVRWQLFERTGSGSILDPHSTAHAVLRSWWQQDQWFIGVALALLIPGLVLRRTRIVAFALALQLVQLFRNGYLPYPYIIAMLPFAALTIGGVLAAVGGFTWLPRQRWLRHRVARARRAVGLPFDASLFARVPATPPWRGVARTAAHVVAGVATVVLVLTVAGQWRGSLGDLSRLDRDRGKARALEWITQNVSRSDYIVVDDALWVDLVRRGYDREHVIWFTKLDVDRDVRLPATPSWRAIDYVVIDHQDDLTVHVQTDGTPSKDTVKFFPTLGNALRHTASTVTFGDGLDAISIRTIDPSAGGKPPVASRPPSGRPPSGRPPSGRA